VHDVDLWQPGEGPPVRRPPKTEPAYRALIALDFIVYR
jgi:hypothetical protein